MGKFLDKYSIKLQLGVACAICVFIVSFTIKVSSYANTVDVNTKRIDKIEMKLDTLATKDDLKQLKQDIKDFIK